MNGPTPASTTITSTMATTDIRNDPKAAEEQAARKEMMRILRGLAKKLDKIEFDLHPESVCSMCAHAG